MNPLRNLSTAGLAVLLTAAAVTGCSSDAGNDVTDDTVGPVVADTEVPTSDAAEKPADRSVENMDSVDEQVAQEIDDAAAVEDNALLEEALTALEETNAALDALDNDDSEAALDALAKVTGQLEILLAREPELALAPVDVVVQTSDVFADVPTIETTVDEVNSLVDEGELQAARLLLNTLVSEVVIETTNLPIATYPTAMTTAAALIDDGEIDDAKAVLNTALRTLVVEEVVLPLPVLRAQAALLEADELAGDVERTSEENDRLADLLTLAREELQVAEVLGYSTNTDFEAIYDQIDSIEDQTSDGKSGTGLFDEIRDLVSSLRDSIAG